MNTFNLKFKLTIACLSVILFVSTAFGQSSEHSTIDLQKARLLIDSLDKQFSKYYFEGDSISLYSMYAKNAEFEGLKGKEILLSWGKEIRSSIKNDSRNLIFTTNSLSTDGEFLVELGIYEVKDSKANSKGKGKYLVIWKREDGNWKLYRDMGL